MRNPGDGEVEKPDRGLIGGGIGDVEIQAADFFPVMDLLVLGSGCFAVLKSEGLLAIEARDAQDPCS